MKRMERDIICGMAERCGLAYIRVLGYAVRVDGYIFLDFAQARGFILRRAEHGIDAAAKPSRAKSRVFDRVLLGVVLLFGIASISSFVWYFHGQTGANEPSHDASVRVSTDTPPAPSMPSSEQPPENNHTGTVSVSRSVQNTNDLDAFRAQRRRASTMVRLKGIAGNMAFVQVTPAGDSVQPQDLQKAVGDRVAEKWTIAATAAKPSRIMIRNEETGELVEIQVGNSAVLSLE